EVSSIEDVRAAKRRAVIDRATELLNTAFDETVMDSEAILREVRERIRVADITEYQGLPAGPNVASSDAIILVEGRADVLTLLRYGIKNAIAVEGTNVPERIGKLTRERTVTVFLDGDRGGDLIRRELQQIGEVDYVARGPEGKSVEDLTRAEVDAALRNKMPIASIEGESSTAVPDGNTVPADPSVTEVTPPEGPGDGEYASAGQGVAMTEKTIADDEPVRAPDVLGLEDHVEAIAGAGRARLLTDEWDSIEEIEAEVVFDTIQEADPVPWAVVVDAPITQRLLDVAAQRGVTMLVGSERGEYVKQPTAVRVRTFEEVG
ncbi:MAG: DNA primase DnaG, partial [Halodesulfurarchaeum sp.]